MITLTIKAVDDKSNVCGRNAEELQSDIEVRDDTITGTLKHIDGYSGFSGIPSEQSGNFLALSFEADEGSEIITELVNGTKGPVKVDDGFCVYRLTDKETQTITVTVKKDTEESVKEYSLSGLACSEE